MCAFQIRKRKKEKKVRDRERRCAIHRQWEKRKRREKARDDRKLCAYNNIYRMLLYNCRFDFSNIYDNLTKKCSE